jgi:hypothetical protein
MVRDPAALRAEAAAYRSLASELGGDTMGQALEQAAQALEAVAIELEASLYSPPPDQG